MNANTSQEPAARKQIGMAIILLGAVYSMTLPFKWGLPTAVGACLLGLAIGGRLRGFFKGTTPVPKLPEAEQRMIEAATRETDAIIAAGSLVVSDADRGRMIREAFDKKRDWAEASRPAPAEGGE